MRKLILSFYLTIRKPRNFLKIVSVFIGSSLILHWFAQYDSDWGATNLILSIDATIASTIMLMIQEESSEVQAQMLKALLELAKSQRDMLNDHTNMLRLMKDTDENLLKTLTKEDKNGP